MPIGWLRVGKEFVKNVKSPFARLLTKLPNAIIQNVKRGTGRARLTLVLVIALFGLLAVLAVLQHRWLGQVSEGERERMQSNLRLAAAHFTEELDGELTHAYLTFQMDSSLPSSKAQEYYADRFSRWTNTAAHPKLVRSVYLADPAAGQSLLRFDPSTARFEASEWPPELERMRKWFERKPDGIPGDAGIVHLTMSPLDDEIPALFVPIITLPKLPPPLEGAHSVPPSTVFATRTAEAVSLALTIKGNHGGLPAHLPLAYAVLILDFDYMKRELLPELANRYFSSEGALDYNLAIVSRAQPEHVIYASDAKMNGVAIPSPDATVDLFALRLDKMNAMMLDTLRSGLPGQGRKQGGDVAYKVLSIQKSQDVTAKNSLLRETDGRWELQLKHRGGSLEAVVAASRRRNLLVSSGIMLLLAVSLVMIMVSTQRGQRLARQQIEFVAGVSHELRTPLAVICSAGENLADGVIDDREQIKRYGALISGEGRRLSEMVEQVLEFAGIQSGRKAYNMLPVDVAEMIDAVLSSLEPALAAEGFEVEKHIASYLPAVMADPSALRRAIQNLLDNAMKYSGESRWIGISATSHEREGTLEVEVKVSDKGIGMSPSETAHIFEPFQRGKASVAAQIHGNGLGLSLVKHIVDAHGGRVEVRSVPGEGSTFALRLPARAAPEAAEVGRREALDGI